MQVVVQWSVVQAKPHVVLNLAFLETVHSLNSCELLSLLVACSHPLDVFGLVKLSSEGVCCKVKAAVCVEFID